MKTMKEIIKQNDNKLPSTSDQRFIPTSTRVSTSGQVRGSFDFPFKDSALENEAFYLARELKEDSQIPKYRYAVSHYSVDLCKKALAAVMDCEGRGDLKVNRAAYFWGTIKRLFRCMGK